MRQALKLHYFSQSRLPGDTDEEPTDEEKLKGYQTLCHEVGISPSDSIAECKKQLKNTLVNIVDLIDTRQTLKKVKVWHNFKAFRNYTLQDGHRINIDEAKKEGGYLACLLQRSRVLSGRVTKKSPS